MRLKVLECWLPGPVAGIPAEMNDATPFYIAERGALSVISTCHVDGGGDSVRSQYLEPGNAGYMDMAVNQTRDQNAPIAINCGFDIACVVADILAIDDDRLGSSEFDTIEYTNVFDGSLCSWCMLLSSNHVTGI